MRALLSSLQLVLLLSCLPLSSAKLRIAGPYIRFHTEPSFIPSDISTFRLPEDRSVLAPGYLFIAPHVANKGYGPQIIDDNGELIWYGFGTVSRFQGRKTYAMNLYVCDYKGEVGKHLCYSEARPEGQDVGIRTAGANRVFDNHYQQVGPDYGIAGDFIFPNPHEFNMLPGGESFLQAVYDLEEVDLRPYGGRKRGYVFNGCFQEVSTRTEAELFRWCFLDHHPLWHTEVFLFSENNRENASTPVGGTGTRNDPWDFMHLNSVDKNEEGDYIVSGRHLNSIIKVAGRNSRSGRRAGETIWRVGGPYSDFELEGDDQQEANFSMQHHCRYHETTESETSITLFNNADNGFTQPTADYSSGITLVVNNVTKKARLERIFKQPQNKLAYAQGSMQILPNGNVQIGWGSLPHWSEFSPNGTLLSHAGAHADANGRLSNYRTYKFPWIGVPLTPPKLVAYCRSCENSSDKTSPLVAYVSWNGATEVKKWRFFVSFKDRKGPWIPAGTFEKRGFETQAHLSSSVFTGTPSFAPFVAVEALDARGKVLSRTNRKTFVPNRFVKDRCNKWGCRAPYPAPFYYIKSYNQADTCMLGHYGWMPQVAVLVVFFILVECFEFLISAFLLPLDSPYQYQRRGRRRGRGRYDFIPNGKLGDA